MKILISKEIDSQYVIMLKETIRIYDPVVNEMIDIDYKDWNSFVEIINKISKLLVLK